MRANDDVKPWVRVAILVVAIALLAIISKVWTGSWLPTQATDILLVQSSLLLVVLGSLLLERHFTAPADALVNAITALATLIPVAVASTSATLLPVVTYLVIVLVISLVAVTLQSRERVPSKVQSYTFRISAVLGQAKVVFSVVFITAVVLYGQEGSALTLPLLIFWGAYVIVWPLGLPALISRLVSGSSKQSTLGSLARIDSPGLARISLTTDEPWEFLKSPAVLVTGFDGVTHWGVPMFSENRSDGLWGTLLLAKKASPSKRPPSGAVAAPRTGDDPPDVQTLLDETFGFEGTVLLGTVREGSSVAQVRFECLPSANIEVGQLVVVPTEAGAAYFQVTDAETSEEAFGGLNYGSRIAVATQVGRLNDSGVFVRHNWVPAMNTPVMQVNPPVVPTDPTKGKFTLGTVPGTAISLVGDFVAGLESHTAILGVTGSGKTEFAFDLIRHALAKGVKVVCIDLTSQYSERLNDLGPLQLSLAPPIATELGDKLFDADTGKFGGGEEKKILNDFAKKIRENVAKSLQDFIDGPDSLGLIELTEISNTKATLWITEIYLTALLRLAQAGGLKSGKVLVVVEEAHTVMPEASFAGLGDFDSKGTIAKISQIALQGRKYGVGLLVLAQRTATVSKSVLTQCNTVISFSCVDDTSIGFLSNVFGASAARQLPNLPRLRAVAHGAWIESELPITFEVPHDPAKAARKMGRLGPESVAVTEIETNERAEDVPF